MFEDLHFVSCMDDVLESRGEKVAPKEVEGAPKVIAIVAELPKTPSGKIKKTDLR